jgi:C4-dicarboxylate transporter DctM subunit
MLIPPSLPMVLYCVFTGDSLGKLLIAGIVPGILASIILFMGVVLVGTINPKTMPKADIRFSWRERFSGLLAAWPIALVFLIIMGGIYSGFFTPTEAGGIAAFVVFLLALVRRVGKRTIIRALSDAALMTAQIFLIALGGILFGRVVGFSGLSTLLGEFITTLALPPMAIMGVIVLIYLVLGCLMDPLAMLVLTIPFVYPVALSLGYDGISFGIIFIILLEIGALTPPIGFNVFVVAATANIDTWVVFRGIIPFFLLLLVVLWIIIVFPQIATWLPSLMF